ANVVNEQNRDFPAGTVGREPAPQGTELTFPVITRGRMTEVKEFEDMIIRALPNGSMVRMKDVARVELGAQSYDLEGRFKGRRTTLIPAVAVPVSLIGTFAGMEALGFSINTLTLFGLVLAIGIVVDDAIVVVENVQRHMVEECCSSKEAAKRAMGEVTAPVIAIVLVLCAVFVPVGFLGGITGQLYKQFAITI